MKTLVLKCGGSSLEELSPLFFEHIQSLREDGWKVVVVHGGGPAIQKMLDQLNIHFEFVDGLRKTTKEMIDLIEMVLSGQINSKLTRYINSFDIPAVGLAGTDEKLLTAEPLHLEKYGLVGEIKGVNTDLIYKLLEEDIVPVISPIAVDQAQERYNINADTAAGAIAAALNAQLLVFVTDVQGIMKDGHFIEELDMPAVESMIATGHIHGGMLPKVKAAMKGLRTKVSKVMIVNGKESELTAENLLKGTTILRGESN